ncbi:MAG: hypothetical protein OEQ53_04670, partial [Saprospiraceae bacterium]|nr:hypothetical protein [Saprospiraceae bacterium]
MKYSRKDFLQMVGGVGAGLTAGLLHLQPNNNLSGTGAASRKLKLGLASYTLRALSLDTTIQIAQQLDLKHIAFKSMHMPLDADAA